jgi:hypothetical protein
VFSQMPVDLYEAVEDSVDLVARNTATRVGHSDNDL